MEYISFSTLKTYNDCGKYVRITKEKRIKDLSPGNIKTHYGTLLHEAVQGVLTSDTTEQAKDRFRKKWPRLIRLFGKYLKPEIKPNRMLEAAELIIEQIKEYLQSQFGNFQVIYIEEKLYFNTDFPQKFIGYIDLVIRTEDGLTHIIDIKTSDSVFFFKKYRDKYKDYQLTLYKHFLSRKDEIDPKKVKTYFLVLERSKSKSIITLIPVTAGPVKVKNALFWMNRTLQLINRDIFLNNRTHCFAFGKTCYFWNTEHCKLNR
jgi:hypothetical protein